MNQGKGKVKLNDELLDKVSGGSDEYDFCAWNPDLSGNHEKVLTERADGSFYYVCKWCELRWE